MAALSRSEPHVLVIIHPYTLPDTPLALLHLLTAHFPSQGGSHRETWTLPILFGWKDLGKGWWWHIRPHCLPCPALLIPTSFWEDTCWGLCLTNMLLLPFIWLLDPNHTGSSTLVGLFYWAEPLPVLFSSWSKVFFTLSIGIQTMAEVVLNCFLPWSQGSSTVPSRNPWGNSGFIEESPITKSIPDG